MKIFILLFFLSFSSYAQNFMLRMHVTEIVNETNSFTYNDVKVILVMKQDSIALVWEDHKPLFFYKKPYNKRISKGTRDDVKKWVEAAAKMHKSENITIRDIFYNKWGELFLITIYMNPGMIIYINRLGGTYPHYFLTMTSRNYSII